LRVSEGQIKSGNKFQKNPLKLAGFLRLKLLEIVYNSDITKF